MYTPTGRFSDQSVDEIFSVVLELGDAPGKRETHTTHDTVRPGFPENVPDFGERLSRGEKLILHEGARAVAEAILQRL